jgi:predicted ester cyclase
MLAEENKTLVRRAIDKFNRGETIDDLLSPDHTRHVLVPGSAVEEPTEFGDLTPYIEVDDQIAEGDKVTTRWTIYIRSEAEDTGDSAAGTQRKASGITIDRVSGEKIKETWTSWNPAHYLPGQIEAIWTDLSLNARGGWPRRP